MQIYELIERIAYTRPAVLLHHTCKVCHKIRYPSYFALAAVRRATFHGVISALSQV